MKQMARSADGPGERQLVGELIGYCNRISAHAGDTLDVMVHTDQAEYEASVVRMIHGDRNPASPGLREEDVASIRAVRRPGRQQVTRTGSYAFIADCPALAHLESVTAVAWIFPTRVAGGEVQGLISRSSLPEGKGFTFAIDESGHLVFSCQLASGKTLELRSDTALTPRTWSFVAAAYDSSSGAVTLYQAARTAWGHGQAVTEANWGPGELARTGAPLLLAAAGWERPEGGRPGWARGCYNGKLGAPLLFDRGLSVREIALVHQASAGGEGSADYSQGLVGRWDFAVNQHSCAVRDTAGQGLDGQLVNMPARAVTGHTWTGREGDFRLAPSEYDAIHFHADDIEDADWQVDFSLGLPAGLRSGVYAVRLRSGTLEDRIPFVVIPSAAKESILVVLPTMTYVAYANLALTPECQPGRPDSWNPPRSRWEDLMDAHPEFGRSLYQRHDDGSGICYSSPRRPVLSLRPDYRTSLLDAPRHLGGDLYLIDWLETLGFDYDVATDDQVHALGSDYLGNYSAVLTGSHPEYCTYEMITAYESYVAAGGRMMYLGGNGFYWVTSVHPERQDVIEVRRGNGGTRPWESEPGELHHSTTGEHGGHWRGRGQIPNRLTGVGTASEGADGCSVGYRRLAASHDPRVAFIFDGVEDEIIGDFGLVMGGAAGDEVDRADLGLGTPPETMVLATALLSEHYSVLLEDRISWRSDRRQGEPRADMTYLENDAGGAVFSVSSMSWLGSLSHADYANNVSRVTANVLRRFTCEPRSTAQTEGRICPTA
jgi:N,N-dimethylformamidase